MKVRASVKKMCENCRVIKRKGKVIPLPKKSCTWLATNPINQVLLVLIILNPTLWLRLLPGVIS